MSVSPPQGLTEVTPGPSHSPLLNRASAYRDVVFFLFFFCERKLRREEERDRQTDRQT